MATYSTIKGFNIQAYATDPYISVEASGTWASGNATNTGRRGVCGLGTQTAAIAAGGNAPPVGVLCESYNGTSWTEVNDLNTLRAAIGPGAGSQTAGLCVGGNGPSVDVANAEKWDGTNWTEVGDLNFKRHSGACMGATNTAAIYSGGSEYPPGTGAEGYLVETESWNGSAWTEVGDLNTGRRYVAGIGPSTAAFLMGGAIPPGSTSTAATEMWNGSSWTTSTSFNTARNYLAGSGGANAQTGALIYGGQPGTQAITEAWNGSSWTEVGDMGTARKSFLGSTLGTTSLALAAFGGPPNPTASEEWSTASPPISIAQEGQVWYNTTSTVLKGLITTAGTGSWASGGALNNARDKLGGGAGTQTAAMIAGGRINPPGLGYAYTETYNGSAWTEVSDLNQNKYDGACFGTVSTAGIYAAGYVTPPGATTTNTEKWNGTSWTEVNNVNTARNALRGSGGTTAGLIYGGGSSQLTEEFNGTSWTEVADLTTARQSGAGAGTSTATLYYAGYDTAASAKNEEWNGSSWTELGDLNSARENPGGAGTITAALASGGDPPPSALVELWNGTAWTEVADLATARGSPGWPGAGTTSATFVAGGRVTSTMQSLTEEWTAPSPLAIKTFTSS